MSANVRTCARSMRPYIQKEIDTARLASQHKASSSSRALLHLQSTLGALTQRPTPQNMCLQNARQTSHLGEYLKCLPMYAHARDQCVHIFKKKLIFRKSFETWTSDAADERDALRLGVSARARTPNETQTKIELKPD